jgi:hypothetical protein
MNNDFWLPKSTVNQPSSIPPSPQLRNEEDREEAKKLLTQLFKLMKLNEGCGIKSITADEHDLYTANYNLLSELLLGEIPGQEVLC